MLTWVQIYLTSTCTLAAELWAVRYIHPGYLAAQNGRQPVLAVVDPPPLHPHLPICLHRRQSQQQHMRMGRLWSSPCPSTLPMSAGTWYETSSCAAFWRCCQPPQAGQAWLLALLLQSPGWGRSAEQAPYLASWRYAASCVAWSPVSVALLFASTGLLPELLAPGKVSNYKPSDTISFVHVP